MYVHVSTGRQAVSDSSRVKITAVVNYMTWVLRIKLRSSGRARSTLNF